ncbi:hypothetical protein RSOL_298290 [Rhizoctonia solani AG-3 Rhs1AP]|uniref:Uncharacterized protein n=1 Tax=Rhizoctonia solani AG-3 Rhs1AP TaxID=1086054 RepID=A0A0A1UJG5_9AGAM|nr:hypothetical protein RSOL_298290 [Rhizoctonia solani AG-3 Rhs1AP]
MFDLTTAESTDRQPTAEPSQARADDVPSSVQYSEGTQAQDEGQGAGEAGGEGGN